LEAAVKKPVRLCATEGCDGKHYGRGWCSKCYWIHSKAGDLEDEIVTIPLPPKPPVDKKRCRARMKDGSRCIRGVRGRGLCSAHWRELCDREEMELREKPLNATRHDYENEKGEHELMEQAAQ
jgi:hypothetical protein